MRERFHYPSFRDHFLRKFDDSFNVYVHNWTAHVLTPNPYFTAPILQQLIIEAIVDSIDDPQGTPDGSRRGSVIDLPLKTHVDTLQETLQGSKDYLEKREVSGVDQVRLFEWRIDLKKLQRIVIACRRSADLSLSRNFLEGETCISTRLLRAKMLNQVGVNISLKRSSEIISMMVEAGWVENNGNVRTYGRDVLV